MIKLTNQQIARIIYGALLLIICLIPLHGFLTTWLGSSFGGLLIWRAWKELLLLPVFGLSALLIYRDKQLRSTFFKDKLHIFMLLFVVLVGVTSVLNREDPAALVLGLTIQVRLFAVYLLARIATFYLQPDRKTLLLTLTVPFVAVVGFGLLQLFILPHDFLHHFGYEKGVTIPPYFTIDEQLHRLRIASTLRGPNTLGAYLLLPIALLLGWLWRHTQDKTVVSKRGLGGVVLLLGALVVLYGSHSRSAWLGLIVSLGVWVLLRVSARARLMLVALGLAGLLIGTAGTYMYRDTTFVRDVILHDNPDGGGEVSSNQGHAEALQAAVEDITRSPVTGCGAGCAGPASVHDHDGARIAENYYLQITQESGILAALLFVGICLLIARRLFVERNDPIAAALLASFAGMAVIALLQHAWADDTIAYIWWGLAGLTMYNGAKSNHYGTKEKSKKTKVTRKPAL